MWGKADPRTRTRTGRRVGRGKHGSRYCRLPQRVPSLLTCRYPHHFHPTPPTPPEISGRAAYLCPTAATTINHSNHHPCSSHRYCACQQCRTVEESLLCHPHRAEFRRVDFLFFVCFFFFFFFGLLSSVFSFPRVEGASVGWMVYRWNVYFFPVVFLDLFLCFWIFSVFFSFLFSSCFVSIEFFVRMS